MEVRGERFLYPIVTLPCHSPPTQISELTLKRCPAVITGSKEQVETEGSVDAGRTSRDDGEFRRCCLTMPPYLADNV